MLSFNIKLIIVLVLFVALSATAYIVGCKCDVIITDMSNVAQTASPIKRLKKFIDGTVRDYATIQHINPTSSQQHRLLGRYHLLGRWTGPEGTYLEVVKQGNGYQVLIQDLDTLRIFDASAVGETMVFERDGSKEKIRATNGDDTGMKWLSGKSDCVTIILGEGYCRD